MTQQTHAGETMETAGTDDARLVEQILQKLKTIYDPEIPVNIFDLGLIYAIDLTDSKSVHIRMTLTAPACPVAGTMPGTVEQAVLGVPGIEACTVELVWEPPWNREMISDEAKLELGIL
ncbi:MAG: SUF system Fe-S cluster assembly protein [Gammaproteobacteria bacterium]|jgi:FeS assembly SUF system protein